MTSTTIQIRIDKKEKEEVKKIFKKLGLNMSSALRMFFRQVVLTRSLPFKVSEKEIKKFKIDRTKLKQFIK